MYMYVRSDITPALSHYICTYVNSVFTFLFVLVNHFHLILDERELGLRFDLCFCRQIVISLKISTVKLIELKSFDSPEFFNCCVCLSQKYTYLYNWNH